MLELFGKQLYELITLDTKVKLYQLQAYRTEKVKMILICMY